MYLQTLFLDANQLSGLLPSFDQLGHLQELAVSSNQLSGPVPSFDNLINLEELFLESNHLSGQVPSFDKLANLQALDLSSNQLSGSLPSLGHLVTLLSLDVSSNQLSGTVPSFDRLISLHALSIANNAFSGDLSALITNLSALQTIDASDNRWDAELPNVLPHGLETLTATNCQFNSEIPQQWALHPRLQNVVLSGNRIRLPLPCLLNLQRLVLSNCSISGLLRDVFAPLWHWPQGSPRQSNLLTLDLSLNQLFGAFDTTQFILSSSMRHSFFLTLQELLLHHNSIHGLLPPAIGNVSIITFDVSFTNVSGELPAGLARVPSLQVHP
jgi:Leucine-rich repeat (LRR) protein